MGIRYRTPSDPIKRHPGSRVARARKEPESKTGGGSLQRLDPERRDVEGRDHDAVGVGAEPAQ